MVKHKISNIIFSTIILFLIVTLTPLNNYFHPKNYGQTIQKDSLIIGDFYKVIGKDETSCQGVLVKYDSLGLVIKTQNEKELYLGWELVSQILDKNDNVSYFAKEIYKIQIQNEEKINHTVMRDTSDECDIYMNNTFRLKDVKIIEIGDSTFKVIKDKYSRDFKIIDIKKIEIKNHGFWGGAIVGVASAFVGWLTIGIIAGANGAEDWQWLFPIATATALPTGLIGGFIGEFVVQDSDYSFNNLSLEIKRARLKLFVKGLLK